MLFSVYYGLGWRPFLEAAGLLVSFVLILSSSVRQASTIAGIGTVMYAVVEGQELILNLQSYWEFGASPQHLVATITPPILVMSSLTMAVMSRIKVQAKIARVHSPD
jgi:Na+/H+ antiporter NhaB